jgi:hypothetical protein
MCYHMASRSQRMQCSKSASAPNAHAATMTLRAGFVISEIQFSLYQSDEDTVVQNVVQIA